MHAWPPGRATLAILPPRELPMSQSETYDIWVISDPDGPVLYFPVLSSSSTSPRDHVVRQRLQAARASSPEGLIHGVWPRTRQRLAGPESRLVAEIADPDVEPRRAAQRAATLARGADVAAWAPEELLAQPEATPRPARRPRASAAPRQAAARRTPARSTTRRAAAPKPAAPPPEPTEAVCRVCFMMRRVEQLEDGVCSFCR